MLSRYDKLFEEYYKCPIGEKKIYADRIGEAGEMLLSNSASQYALNESARDREVIVSLTSIPERLDCVVSPIQCMLVQTERPDRIILWLNEECAGYGLPPRLSDLKKYGLEIEFIKDIGPHKKYFYTMQRYPDAVVITIDDDMYYKRTFIEELLHTYEENPECVCAFWTKKMKFTGSGIPYPYSEFEQGKGQNDFEPSHNLLAIGSGGILYPPHCMNKQVFDLELIQKLALKGDDIWLKAMEVLEDIKVARVKGWYQINPCVKGSQGVALYHENYKANDKIMKDVFQYFNLREFFTNEKIGDYSQLHVLERWIKLYQQKVYVKDYLKKENVSTVAIYGLGRIGTLLLQDLRQSQVNVLYGIDRRAGQLKEDIPIITLEDEWKTVDMIIVAASVDYDELKAQIRRHTDCKIMLLNDIIMELCWCD